jgi:filamentous hemagglutinin family protein
MKTKIVNNKTVPFKVNAISAMMLLILFQNSVEANPNGATIINGQVSIDRSLENITTITNSPNAIINWQNFNISQNEITRFIQQNSQSAVLNRVIGQNPSEILGQLISNGQVFLINPNGIVFGANSVIDTQGMIASTLNLSNQDFLKGNYHFVAGNNAGNILNQGIIRAGEDGNIILIAPDIENSGIISTEGGQITLAAGSELTLTNLDSPEIQFQIQAPENKVLNMGKILTQGGAINLFAGSITHSGELNANSVEVDKQGNIKLVALQDVNLNNQSLITANHAIGKGGNIQITADTIAIKDESEISVTGQTGGGEILIGGDYQGKNPDIHNAITTTINTNAMINANAKLDKDGGRIIVWSDDTTIMRGTINAKGGENSGDGGFVEVSGKQHLLIDGLVDVTAKNGETGKLLLDPGSVNIQAGANTAPTSPFDTVNKDWLQDQLDNANVTIKTSNSTNGAAEDIHVNTSITWNSGNFLELIAGNDINLNYPVTNTGIGDLILTAGDTISSGSSIIAANISLNGGALKINGNSLWTNDTTITGNIDNFGVIKSVANNTLNGIIANTGTFDWDSGSLTLFNVDSKINNSGTFRANSPSQITGTGTFNNSGLVEKTVSATPDQFNVIFNNSNGTFDTSIDSIALINGGTHDGTLTINNGTLKMAGGTHILGDGLVVTGIGDLETNVAGHTGILTIDNNKTTLTSDFQNNSNLIINASATLKANGAFDNSTTGIISGKGTIEAATFDNNGSISPGTSPGILNIVGDLNLGTTSVIDIEIEGNIDTTPEFDQINVTGNVDLGGTLNVTLPTGFDPIFSNFPIITSAGNIGGTFTTLNPPSGYNMVTDITSPTVTLKSFGLLGDILWDNDSGDGLWTTLVNWSTDILPKATDSVVIDIGDSSLVRLNNGSHTIDKLRLNHHLFIDNAQLTVKLEINASKPIDIETGGTLLSEGSLLGTDKINIRPAGTLELYNTHSHTLDIINDGTLSQKGIGTATLTGNVINNTNGLIDIDTALTLTTSPWINDGTINTQANSTFAIVASTSEFTNKGTLKGFGTIKADEVINEGIIAPGASPGTLTFTNNLTLKSSSNINIELAGTSPSNYDKIQVGNTATLDGSLNVTETGGFTPTTDTSFSLITCGTACSGNFSNISLPSADYTATATAKSSGSQFTAPVVIDPVVTDPVVIDPIVNDPIIVDPVVTDPVVIDPIVNDPIIVDPIVTDPVVIAPIVNDPIIVDPVVTDPVVIAHCLL